MSRKKPSEEIIPPPLSLEELEEQFPALAAEITNSKDQMIPLRTEKPDDLLSVKVSSEKVSPAEKKPAKEVQPQDFTLSGYIPTAESYIQRCSTVEEAEKIIAFMEKQEELDKEQAELLRNKIKTEGLSSFGDSKTSGYYERKTRRAHKRTVFKPKTEKKS
jgi:hypothetical protein